MKEGKCIVLLVSLILTIAPLLQAQSQSTASKPTHHFEKTFSLDEHPTLTVENTSIHGNVEVQAWDRSEIKISADIYSSNTRVEAIPVQGALNVKLRRTGTVSTDSVHFRIWVPAACAIELSSLGGKITVRGIRARLKASTTDGDIELTDVSGQSVDAMSSISGNITLSSAFGHQGKYNLYSASGKVSVVFPDPASFTLDAVTLEGNIEIEGFRLANEQRVGRHVAGMYGGGLAILMVRTHQGPIHLRKQ